MKTCVCCVIYIFVWKYILFGFVWKIGWSTACISSMCVFGFTSTSLVDDMFIAHQQQWGKTNILQGDLDCEFEYCYTNMKWLYSNRGHHCGCHKLKKLCRWHSRTLGNMALLYISFYIVPVINTWQFQFTLTFAHYLHVFSLGTSSEVCSPSRHAGSDKTRGVQADVSVW